MSFPNDFIEIDFLPVETAKSGDAITIRSAKSGLQFINIVDGGFTDMGSTIVDHINKYYTNQEYIDNVILTHPDGDHAPGPQICARKSSSECPLDESTLALLHRTDSSI